jgi:hypothetical protein
MVGGEDIPGRRNKDLIGDVLLGALTHESLSFVHRWAQIPLRSLKALPSPAVETLEGLRLLEFKNKGSNILLY